MLKDKLNELLSNYEVMFHKLQTYHWYVKGISFFEDHAKFEEYYDEAFAAIDEIAEKLLMIGGSPLSSMVEYTKHSSIEEAQARYIDAQEAFGIIKGDYETLLGIAKELKKAADDEDNYLISAFADDIIEQVSKHVWMLGQKLA